MKKRSKLSSELNTFVSLLLCVVILFQAVICMYCLRLIGDKKKAWQSGIIRDFENYVSVNLNELASARKILISTNELTDGLKTDNPDYSGLREKIYGLQDFSNGTIHAAVFNTSGEITEISGNISAWETEEVKKSFLLYMDEIKAGKKYGVEEEYYDFFDFSDGEYHSLYFISISPVIEYKSSTEEEIGHLCTFTQVEKGAVISGYDDVSDISLTLKNARGKSVILSGGDSDENFLFTQRWSGNKVKGTSWQTDGSITLSASSFDGSNFLTMFVVESLLLITIILIFNHILKRRTIAPLKQIGKFMRHFRISDSFKPIEVEGNAEIEELAEEVNKMVKRNKSLANDIMLKQGKLYEAENLKNEATLYALQNQVNPHYLYNIFELIRSIALVRGVEEIETISVSVSEIFRYNLKKENTALLKNELEITKRYVSIMQVKYGDSFDVIYDLAPETLDIKVPKMIFQPIIENAFGHGYVRREEKFFVKIRSWIEGSTLYMSFYDNGLGMTEEELSEINSRINSDNYSGGKGIGIANLAHRLKMMHGDNCSFRVESQKDKYTEVRISIIL